jgi:hypothetical protein
MASFSNVSFNRKGEHSSSHSKAQKDKENTAKNAQKHKSSSNERELKEANINKQKSKLAAKQQQCEQTADIDKRSQQFENEFAKNKAKEFKDSCSQSKSAQNKFQRSDQAKKLRRNHIDNQRARKNQEYCLIEEKKYIKKRFLKDDASEAMEDMDKDFAADYETAKEERARSCSRERRADEKEASYTENAKQTKSQAAKKNSYHASERHASESECSDKYIRKEQEECSDSEDDEHCEKDSRKDKKNCEADKQCKTSQSSEKSKGKKHRKGASCQE